MPRATRPTLVYRYGAHVVDGIDAYRDEERAMHRAYSALVELRRREIEASREDDERQRLVGRRARVAGDNDNGGSSGGGGGSSSLGFLAWIDPDDDAQESAPRCPPSASGNADSRARAHAWCKADQPSAYQRGILNAAIARIAAGRGPVCKQIANAAKSLMRKGKFRIFTKQDIPSGLPVKGGLGYQQGVVLFSSWLQLLNGTRGTDGYIVNLEFAIAHEIQHHLWGSEHANLRNAPSYYEQNPYDGQCAGFEEPPL